MIKYLTPRSQEEIENNWNNSSEEEKEDLFFSDWLWKNESCANYVGYLKSFINFNIIVSRECDGKAGLYSLTKVPGNANASSGGEWWRNSINNLNMNGVKKIMENYDKFNF